MRLPSRCSEPGGVVRLLTSFGTDRRQEIAGVHVERTGFLTLGAPRTGLLGGCVVLGQPAPGCAWWLGFAGIRVAV